MPINGKKVLVIGASSDLAVDLNRMLIDSGAVVGLHYNKNEKMLDKYKGSKLVKSFQKNLNSSKACHEIIEDFVKWAGGIDYLVQASGDIKRPIHWSELAEDDWKYDLDMNLIMPFFLAQKAAQHMKANGGRIVLMSTSSAAHGGGAMSLAYGTAKAGIECVAKGLARDLGKYNILVNAIAPGFIVTKFHTEKMGKTKDELEKRTESIAFKRAGTTKEFADAAMFLLSEMSNYITGQVITVSGGDWL